MLKIKLHSKINWKQSFRIYLRSRNKSRKHSQFNTLFAELFCRSHRYFYRITSLGIFANYRLRWADIDGSR